MIVGIDIGGTFTDVVVVDGERRLYHKVRSTPDDPGRAVLQGLADLGLDLSRIERLIHGTTVATNTIIQRRGAVTGLVTTRGHRDVLGIRRGNKPERDVFDLLWREPEPLVPRFLRLDVGERLDYRGRVVSPLDRRELELAADHLEEHGVESVAVCFLFSYLDDAHEREAAAFLRERLPGVDVSLSSEILPQWREYERTSTTVADAYVKPRLARYVEGLAASLRAGGCEREPLIMKSNGGVMTAGTAAARPIETFLSGPAGGVVAGKYHGRAVGRENLVTIDMGGTSFDVSLVTGGGFSTTTQGWVDPSTPISVAMLDIRTVGAGGGSIARIDSGGALKVGPDSAGAVPGPACYGQGGTEPTVTDANVVLGRIAARTLLAGRLEIDPALAYEAVEQAVAAPLGLEVVDAAAGIVRICVANMAKEIRALTAERGVDPRGYALLAGGGGGPLHGAALAREFGIREVVVPAHPGLLSAGGLLLSDLRVDRVRSFPIRLERDGAEHLRAAVADLLSRVEAELAAEGFEGEATTACALDMKYAGQNWELTVELEAELTVESVAAAFDRHHERLYGFALPGQPHDVLAVRASAVGPTRDADALVPRRELAGSRDALAADHVRPVWDDEERGFVDCSVYAWDALRPGDRLPGPAVIEGMDSTVWLPAGALATVDDGGNVLLELG